MLNKPSFSETVMSMVMDPSFQTMLETITVMHLEEQKTLIKNIITDNIGDDLPKIEAIIDVAPAAISVAVEGLGKGAYLFNSLLSSISEEENFKDLSSTMQKTIAKSAFDRYQAFIEAGFDDKAALKLTAAYATYNPVAGLNKRQ